FRRMHGQEFAVVGKPRHATVFDVVERVPEGHLAEGVVMAVGLPVGGDVDQLRPLPGSGEAARQAVGEYFTAVKKLFEGNRLGNGAIVKVDGNASPRRKRGEIR